MAYNVTLLQLRNKARQRSDTVSTQFVTDSELNDFVNDSVAELWELLVTSYGEDYYHVKAAPFSTVLNQADYPIDGTVIPSSDFFKLAGLDAIYAGNGSNIYVPLRRFMQAERSRNQNTNWITPTFGNVRYRLNGTNVEFLPIPTGIYQVRARYVPCAKLLVADSDTFDSINAWHEYVTEDVAAKIMEKMERDSGPHIQRKMMMAERIKDGAKNRDSGEPNRVVDVTGLTDNYTDDYFDLWR